MFGTAKPEAELAKVVWTSRDLRDESVALRDLPWYKNYRYQGLALIVLVVIILMIY